MDHGTADNCIHTGFGFSWVNQYEAPPQTANLSVYWHGNDLTELPIFSMNSMLLMGKQPNGSIKGAADAEPIPWENEVIKLYTRLTEG